MFFNGALRKEDRYVVLGSLPNCPPFLFLTNNMKMDRTLTKIKWKIHTFFTLYFKFLRYFFKKNCKIQRHQLFYFFLFLLAFTSADFIFIKILEHIWKKCFHHQFFFINRFAQTTSHPLNGQNLLRVTKVFCWCSLSLL